MAQKRKVEVFSLSFLDVICCGFGAVILLYTIINAQVDLLRSRRASLPSAQVSKLQEEVLEGERNLVRLRNQLQQTDSDTVSASSRAKRLIEELQKRKDESSVYDETTLAKRERIEKLKSDVKALEESTRRLEAGAKVQTPNAERVAPGKSSVANRRYLTGLALRGKRVLVLVDRSASMLDDDLVNVIRLRNSPEPARQAALKWRRAVDITNWIVAQLPQGFRILRADLVGTLATGVRPLQRTEHRLGDRNRIAALIGLANEIELGPRLDVTGEAVEAKTVVHLGKAAREDLGAVLVHVDPEELPVARRRAVPLLLLDHHLVRHQLHDRTLGVVAAACSRHCHGLGQFPGKVVHVEVPHLGHLADAFEGLVGHLDLRFASASDRRRQSQQRGEHRAEECGLARPGAAPWFRLHEAMGGSGRCRRVRVLGMELIQHGSPFWVRSETDGWSVLPRGEGMCCPMGHEDARGGDGWSDRTVLRNRPSGFS